MNRKFAAFVFQQHVIGDLLRRPAAFARRDAAIALSRGGS
jgi:hypothetical protein